ncbi:MAG: ABC transporter ATP-binding protein [Candidatus Omnitrophica bacterium]|nr:ABC transporter ATP-binding protein [Candidatus Omnitrophota bacterium]
MKSDNIAVSVDKLEKRFGDFTAVNRVSFEVGKGEIFGFLGPNGAGKSTTIRMLCGLIAPTSGTGTVGGFDVMREQENIKEHIGYMSQKFSLYDDLTVKENIEFYGGVYKISKDELNERKNKVIEIADIKNFTRSLTRTLSGGVKQRLALGCAILHKPRIIFLDEPTSGVDPITRNNFWDIIKAMAKEGVTVFVTTHYMDEAENCNRLGMIYKGNLIAMGTPEEMKTKFMKQNILDISVPDPESWIDRINALPEIEETAIFGVRIHTVCEDERSAIRAVENLLKQKGARGYSVRKIKPSLEDVFVSLIESYDKEHKDESKKS